MTAKSQPDPHNGAHSRWGLDASELLKVEDSGEWSKQCASFSLYVTRAAQKKKKTKSSLWRLRSAGRYYNELRKKFDPTGKYLPRLEDPLVQASPESLEIVGKISRVAPSEFVEELQRRTMEGEISRRELRDIWETYRPVLGGKTARGRGIEAPRYDKRNGAMRRALAEANSLAPIVQRGPAWLGVLGSAYVYRVVHISGNDALKHLYPSTPDVVVLLAEKEHSPLVLHGVEAGFTVEGNKLLESFDRYSTNVDYLWFATSKRLYPQEIAKIPEEIGVLFTGQESIEVIRHASRISSGIDEREGLLRILLREASRS
jgi:hypothetical protein